MNIQKILFLFKILKEKKITIMIKDLSKNITLVRKSFILENILSTFFSIFSNLASNFYSYFDIYFSTYFSTYFSIKSIYLESIFSFMLIFDFLILLELYF